MAKNFFSQKKPWSVYKDFILDYYLKPYIAKVQNLRKPILIIDCCAGRGRFEDGNIGSPLIIANHIREWSDKGIKIKGIFFEKKRALFNILVKEMPLDENQAILIQKDFRKFLETIKELTGNSTVFLYVDPYGIKELYFKDFSSIFAQIKKSNASVELLLNFNSLAFLRNAFCVLKIASEAKDLAKEKLPRRCMSIDQLNEIAGGDYWIEIVKNTKTSYQEKEVLITEAYRKQLNRYFNIVCSYAIKESSTTSLPKYQLIFGTRHSDGLILMNNTMYLAKEKYFECEAEGRLFDLRPQEEQKDFEILKFYMRQTLKKIGVMSKKDLKIRTIVDFFTIYSSSDLNNCITELLKEERIFSSNGKKRINDNILIGACPFIKNEKDK